MGAAQYVRRDNSCCPFLKCRGGVDSVQADGSIKEVQPSTCQVNDFEGYCGHKER